jgi:transcriptional regulator with XRE-family HTH domain
MKYKVFNPQKRTRIKPPEGRMSLAQKARIRTLMGGLNQADLATMLDVHTSHVSLLINGRRMPSVELAGRMARILHVTVDDLLDTLTGR